MSSPAEKRRRTGKRRLRFRLQSIHNAPKRCSLVYCSRRAARVPVAVAHRLLLPLLPGFPLSLQAAAQLNHGERVVVCRSLVLVPACSRVPRQRVISVPVFCGVACVFAVLVRRAIWVSLRCRAVGLGWRRGFRGRRAACASHFSSIRNAQIMDIAWPGRPREWWHPPVVAVQGRGSRAVAWLSVYVPRQNLEKWRSFARAAGAGSATRACVANVVAM